MVENIPARLYKFQTYNNYSIQNLKRDQFWFSKPEKLNDPFDCAIPFVFEWTDDDFKIFFDEHLDKLKIRGGNIAITVKKMFFTNEKPNQNYKDYVCGTNEYYMRLRIINQISKMGISCFTESSDNLLMWSHYADAHKGFCMEFDTNYLPFCEPKKLHQVVYSHKYPSLSPLDILQSEYMSVDILITKSKSWEYEKEWRLIVDEGDNPFQYDISALKSIYFGCAMPDKQVRKIAKIFSKSDVQLFRMQRSYSEFNLVSAPYKE